MSDNTLDDVIKAIDKAYGDNSINYLTGKHSKPKEVISTGVTSLDMAVGNGGFATGSVVEVYGPESSGKTTLALFCIAAAQSKGYDCAFIDMEHAIDTDLAAAYGVDTSKVLFCQPDSGEEALGKVEMIIESGKVKVIVVDSVDALVPRSVLEGDFEDSNMGKQAKMMSQAMRKLSPMVEKKDVILIFINQIRMKIGVMYGNPETTSGGNALKFYAKYRLDVRAKEKIKEGDTIIGSEVCVKVKKNKKAPPFRECQFKLIYGKGIDRHSEMASVALAKGIISKSGAWFFMGEDQIGQGIKSVEKRCKEDPEFYKRLEAAIYTKEDTDDTDTPSN